MKTYTCHRVNTEKLAEKIEELSADLNIIISVIRTSEFENAGPIEGDWADYIILYKWNEKI
jgi:hypothetical protein